VHRQEFGADCWRKRCRIACKSIRQWKTCKVKQSTSKHQSAGKHARRRESSKGKLSLLFPLICVQAEELLQLRNELKSAQDSAHAKAEEKDTTIKELDGRVAQVANRNRGDMRNSACLTAFVVHHSLTV